MLTGFRILLFGPHTTAQFRWARRNPRFPYYNGFIEFCGGPGPTEYIDPIADNEAQFTTPFGNPYLWPCDVAYNRYYEWYPWWSDAHGERGQVTRFSGNPADPVVLNTNDFYYEELTLLDLDNMTDPHQEPDFSLWANVTNDAVEPALNVWTVETKILTRDISVDNWWGRTDTAKYGWIVFVYGDITKPTFGDLQWINFAEQRFTAKRM